MRPVIRWTIGPVHNLGFVILRYSVRQVKRLYGELFRYIICHNGLDSEQLSMVENLGCECVDQHNFCNELLIETPAEMESGPAWKIYPPRLSLETHEIFIDNDLVLHSRVDLGEYLERQDMIIATEGLLRNYGKFDEFVRPDVKLNTGFIGLPPEFDLKAKMNEMIQESGVQAWETHFDEQGLFISVVQDLPTQLIPLTDISVAWSERDYKSSRLGMHFVGANQGDDEHWIKYTKEALKV